MLWWVWWSPLVGFGCFLKLVLVWDVFPVIVCGFLQWSLGCVPNGFGKVPLRASRMCFEWSYESDLHSHQKVFLVVSVCMFPMAVASTGLCKVVLGVFECVSNGL